MKFKKRSGTLAVYVPGHGLVYDERILEGDLGHLVPSILVACEDEESRVPQAPTEVPLEPAYVEFDVSDTTETSNEAPELSSEPSLAQGVKEQAAAILARKKRK